jgi:hypothetical protein
MVLTGRDRPDRLDRADAVAEADRLAERDLVAGDDPLGQLERILQPEVELEGPDELGPAPA